MSEPPLPFAEKEDEKDGKTFAPWRPLTMAEERAGIQAIASETDAEVRAFGVMLATGTEALIDELKAQFEAQGDTLTPDTVAALKLNPSLVARLTEEVEAGLLRAHTKGPLQGRRA